MQISTKNSIDKVKELIDHKKLSEAIDLLNKCDPIEKRESEEVEENEMSEKDIEKFENIGFSKLNLNEKKILNFKDNNSVFGLGWSHNMGSDGIWSEGNMSTILFNFNNYNKKKYIVKIKVRSISTKKNESLNFQIFFNNKIKKRYSLKNIDELNNHLITFEVKEGKLSNGNHLINFLINNPISPLEKYQSPDGRKLGILLESIELAEII